LAAPPLRPRSGSFGRDGLADHLGDRAPFRVPEGEGSLGALAQRRDGQMPELLAAGGDLGRELTAIGQELG
jgi:hypothetical protein